MSKTRRSAIRTLALSALFAMLCLEGPVSTRAAVSDTNPDSIPLTVFEATPGGIACRAGNSSALALTTTPSGGPAQTITRNAGPHAGGLTIILRSPIPLDSYPDARAAYERAAARWEAAIRTPITIVIDVFFLPLPPEIAGFTQPQSLRGTNIYPAVRSALVAGSSNGSDVQLYLRSPESSLPTDIGYSGDVITTSANFRALGLINPVADPVGEFPFFGRPPLIGLNAIYPWDFDPTDGIDADKLDFDGVVTHEMGHILGFLSNVGSKELNPSLPIRPTVLDFFRFRPGIILPNFPTQNRLQSSGGDQVFYGMGPQLFLSTGRPDGSGGDGAQASHWKFQWPDAPEIGVMTPFVDFGWRLSIRYNDLAAFDTIGYTVNPSVLGP